jgi:outer membrane receptor protein involved in Fe transport
LSLAVENLTDEDYRTHGSGVNEPGRNLVVALQTTF